MPYQKKYTFSPNDPNVNNDIYLNSTEKRISKGSGNRIVYKKAYHRREASSISGTDKSYYLGKGKSSQNILGSCGTGDMPMTRIECQAFHDWLKNDGGLETFESGQFSGKRMYSNMLVTASAVAPWHAKGCNFTHYDDRRPPAQREGGNIPAVYWNPATEDGTYFDRRNAAWRACYGGGATATSRETEKSYYLGKDKRQAPGYYWGGCDSTSESLSTKADCQTFLNWLKTGGGLETFAGGAYSGKFLNVDMVEVNSPTRYQPRGCNFRHSSTDDTVRVYWNPHNFTSNPVYTDEVWTMCGSAASSPVVADTVPATPSVSVALTSGSEEECISQTVYDELQNAHDSRYTQDEYDSAVAAATQACPATPSGSIFTQSDVTARINAAVAEATTGLFDAAHVAAESTAAAAAATQACPATPSGSIFTQADIDAARAAATQACPATPSGSIFTEDDVEAAVATALAAQTPQTPSGSVTPSGSTVCTSQETLDELQAEYDALNDDYEALNDDYDALNDDYEALNDDYEALNAEKSEADSTPESDVDKDRIIERKDEVIKRKDNTIKIGAIFAGIVILLMILYTLFTSRG